MLDNKNKKEIYILPSYAHKALLQCKKVNPLRNIKVISKEEVISNFTYTIDEHLIIEIMKLRNVNYDIGQIYARNMRFINPTAEYKTAKLIFLQSLKKELLGMGLLSANPYFVYELKNADVFLDCIYQNDAEIAYLFGKEKIVHTFTSPKETKVLGEVLSFTTIEEEVRHLFISLCQLIEDGYPINKLCVLAKSEEYGLLLKKYAHAYNLPLNFSAKESLYSIAIAGKLIREFKLENNLEKAIEKMKASLTKSSREMLDQISKVLNSYIDEKLTAEQKIDVFENLLKKSKLPNQVYLEAVTVIDNYERNDGKTFILGFEMGTFPPVSKDEEYLSDEEKSLIHQCTSKESNIFAKKEILEFLNSTETILSNKSLALSGIFYPSPLIAELGMKVRYPELCSRQYSDKDLAILLADYKDQERIFDIRHPNLRSLERTLKIPYNSFSNVYQYVRGFTDNDVLHLSYTQLKTFFQCQFRFYLDKVLRVEQFAGNLATDLGSLAHTMLEESEKENFSYWETRQKLLNDSNLDKKSRLFAERILDNARNVIYLNKLQKQQMENPLIFTECVGHYALDDKTFIKGIMDKVVITGDKQQYISIIDYKSGNEDFKKDDIQFGYSLQLPIYALLILSIKEFASKEVIGLYIQPTASKVLAKWDDDPAQCDFRDDYLLNGISVDEFAKMQSFAGDLTSPYIRNFKLDVQNKLSRYAKIASTLEINHYREIAREKIIEADKKIRQNDFAINPKKINSSPEACQYCPYEDICFKKERDVVHIITKEESEENVNGLDS